MKSVDEILLSNGRRMSESDGEISPRYIVSTFRNVTMNPSVQLTYANKFLQEKKTYSSFMMSPDESHGSRDLEPSLKPKPIRFKCI
jgi:hypothetical protein